MEAVDILVYRKGYLSAVPHTGYRGIEEKVLMRESIRAIFASVEKCSGGTPASTADVSRRPESASKASPVECGLLPLLLHAASPLLLLLLLLLQRASDAGVGVR